MNGRDGVSDFDFRPADFVFSEVEEAQMLRAIEEYRDALQAGRHVDRPELLRRYPAIARELTAALDGLDFIENVAPQLSDGHVLVEGDAVRIGSKATLGDFRILREIGKGGMGVVYEAEQLSLGRRVALKVLPFAAVMDSRQLVRFKNEAQAAASLQHQNIVPIYSVGCERGVHYYAMQYVEGQTLAEVIRQFRRVSALEPRETRAPADPGGPGLDLTSQVASGQFAPAPSAAALAATVDFDSPAPPSASEAVVRRSAETAPLAALSTEKSTKTLAYFRTIANLSIQAAEALDHAHKHGILHRDVKPGNLLLDTTGNLWVTDFGLAKLLDPLPDGRGTPGWGAVTMTGDIVGTLRYMSPEQALAKRVVVDHRTDIYSLGATLYELLTLQPVFPGRDRQELLKQIAFEEPRPPRRINKSIPAELETVVLKATAKNPQERYATAQDLADDLRRYLDDKPIQAKRPGMAQRLAKWSRRHRTVVWSMVLIMLVVTLALGLSMVLVWQEKNRTAAAYQAEAQERQRADENYELALKAVEDIYLKATEKWLPGQAQLAKQDQLLIQQMMEFYEEFARINQADPHMAERTALAYQRAGTLYRLLGQSESAERSCEQAIKLQETLVAQFPARPEYRRALAETYTVLGELARSRGRLSEAEQHWERCHDLRIQLATEFPQIADYQSELGGVLNNLATCLAANRRLPDACQLLERAVRHQQAALKVDPQHSTSRHFLGNHWRNLALFRTQLGQFSEAETAYREALSVDEPLVREFPEARNRSTLGETWNNFGLLLRETRRFSEAEEAYSKALDVHRKLASDYPGIPDYSSDVGATLNNLASLQIEQGRLVDSCETLREAITWQQAALKVNPRKRQYQEFLANHYHLLAETMRRQGKHEQAEEALRELLAVRKQLAEGSAEDAAYRLGLAEGHRKLGDLLFNLGRFQEAEENYVPALDVLKTLAATRPQDRDMQDEYAHSLNNFGLVLEAMDRLRDSAAIFREALAVREALAERWHEVPAYRADLARVLKNLGRVVTATGQPAEAAKLYERGIAIRRQLAAEQPRDAGHLRELSNLHAKLGLLFDNTHRLPEAERAFAESVAIDERVVAEFPPTPEDWNNLASSHNSLAIILRHAGRLEDAEKHCRRAVELQQRLVSEHAGNAHHESNMAIFAAHLASLLRKRGELPEAHQLLDLGVEHLRVALKATPEHRGYQPLVRWLNADRGVVLALLGQHQPAVDDAKQLLAAPAELLGKLDLYSAACIYSVASAAVSKDEQQAKRQELAKQYSERAIELLRQAVAQGYDDLDHLGKDADLDPVRQHPDFAAVVEEIKSKAKFSPSKEAER